jgi:hypothetical protein
MSYRRIDSWESIPKALQNMTSLRSLTLQLVGQPHPPILEGCTFKLDSFSCLFPTVETLQFLNNQPSITHITLCTLLHDNVEFGATYLPNLTRVFVGFPFLLHLIPGRPVSEVEVIGPFQPGDSFELGFFALSTAPIRKLNAPCNFLYPRPVQLFVPIFPSLVHLVINNVYSFNQVRFSLFSFYNHWMLSNYSIVWT